MSNRSAKQPATSPIIHAGNFLHAIRDVGYQSPSLAIAELIDNAIQAEAKNVALTVTQSASPYSVALSVEDDGLGMPAEVLAMSVGFGGSTRFGNRNSLGRFGMGLPCATLSCSRRVHVTSWQNRQAQTVTLELDRLTQDPTVSTRGVEREQTTSGTRILLDACDRITYQRPGSFANRLSIDLGRIFRNFLSNDFHITVNGRNVVPRPHLSNLGSNITQIFDELHYEVPTPEGSARVRVRFSELWSEDLAAADNSTKRRLGISNTKQTSVLRAGREICSGWLFMGSKRKENYDDWWRCEIDFDPSLDERFGINFSKQGIAPDDGIIALLTSDIEPIARILNSRVRKSFEAVRRTDPFRKAERIAQAAHESLRPLPQAHRLDRSHPYAVELSDLDSTAPFDVKLSTRRLNIRVNQGHPLSRDLIAPLAASNLESDRETAAKVVLALIAAAHVEHSQRNSRSNERQEWGDVYSAFLSRFA